MSGIDIVADLRKRTLEGTYNPYANTGRDWPMYRGKRGGLRWYQRFVEAWLIVTGRWSLHRAWQAGYSHGTKTEWHRIVVMKGG